MGIDLDMTVTRDGTFSARKAFLQTNGCEHIHIAFSVDYSVFSNNKYNHNKKVIMTTTIIVNIY